MVKVIVTVGFGGTVVVAGAEKVLSPQAVVAGVVDVHGGVMAVTT